MQDCSSEKIFSFSYHVPRASCCLSTTYSCFFSSYLRLIIFLIQSLPLMQGCFHHLSKSCLTTIRDLSFTLLSSSDSPLEIFLMAVTTLLHSYLLYSFASFFQEPGPFCVLSLYQYCSSFTQPSI